MRSEQACMFEESPAGAGLALKPAHSSSRTAAQAAEVVHGGIGQSGVVDIVPKGLDRIEFGGVGRQPFQNQPCPVVFEGSLDNAAAVGWEAIPQKQHLFSSVSAQGLEKSHDMSRADAAPVEGPKPTQAAGRRSGQHQADSRERLPVEGFYQDRGLPPGCPGGAHRGPLGKSRLVEKANPGVQPLGFFLIRGHTDFFQRAIPSSSLSLAWRVGRWRLQRSFPSILQVWAKE